MDVKLLTYTQIEVVVLAARTSHNSFGKGEKEDFELLKKLIEWGHLSVFEHLHLSWQIKDCSQVCMSQITRHRTFNFTVKSKRFTLKKSLKNAKKNNLFILDESLDIYMDRYLDILKSLNIPNDYLEYLVPMSFLTDMIVTTDLRNLFNFMKQRLDKKAHFEIRFLANEMLNLLPLNIRALVNEYLKIVSSGN